MEEEKKCETMQVILSLAGLGLGAYCGWQAGNDAVAYTANSIQGFAKNPPPLDHLVNQHPIITKINLAAFYSIIPSKIGGLIGKVLDS
ncbi:hypothetical protein HZA97_00335 [Candidatus Woesearchaeota archaeon]|nr:hypothetical protein [Candidatus Woesearchaeota archaeon]